MAENRNREPWVSEAWRVLSALKGVEYHFGDLVGRIGDPAEKIQIGDPEKVIKVFSRWEGNFEGVGVMVTEDGWSLNLPSGNVLSGGAGMPISVLLFGVRVWNGGKQAQEAPAGGMDLLNAETARTLGVVQEINRQLLHPRGLALAIDYHPTFSDVNALPAVLSIQDHRLDPEGVRYADETVATPEFDQKADNFDRLLADRMDARQSALGYIVQPLPYERESYRVALYKRDSEEPSYEAARVLTALDQQDAAEAAIEGLPETTNGTNVAVWLDGFPGEQPDVFEVRPRFSFTAEHVDPNDGDIDDEYDLIPRRP